MLLLTYFLCLQSVHAIVPKHAQPEDLTAEALTFVDEVMMCNYDIFSQYIVENMTPEEQIECLNASENVDDFEAQCDCWNNFPKSWRNENFGCQWFDDSGLTLAKLWSMHRCKDCVPDWYATKASCTNECSYVDMIIKHEKEGNGKPCPGYYNCQENDGECRKTEKVCEKKWFGKYHVCADVREPSRGHGWTGIQKIREYKIPFIESPEDEEIFEKKKQDECKAWCEDQYGAGCCELRPDDCIWKPNSVMRYSLEHELSTAIECAFAEDLHEGFHDYSGDVKFQGACADMYSNPLAIGGQYELMDTVEECEARCEESEACESFSYVKASAAILLGTEVHELPKDACQLYTQMGIRGDNTAGVTCYVPKYRWNPEDYNVNKYMAKDMTCECSEDEECISYQLGRVIGSAQKCMFLCAKEDRWAKHFMSGRCCKASAVEGLEDVFECEMLSKSTRFEYGRPLRRSLSEYVEVWTTSHYWFWGFRNSTEEFIAEQVGGHGILVDFVE